MDCWNVPSPLPGKIGDAVGALIDDGHAKVAVAGEITGRDRGSAVAHRVGDRFLEGAVAFAQKHGNVIAAGVARGQVETAVAIEIARDKATGERPHRHFGCGLERAVAVAQQHGHTVGVGARRLPGRDGHCRSRPPRSKTELAPTSSDDASAKLPWSSPSSKSTTDCAIVGHGQVEVPCAEIARNDRYR